MFAYLPTDNQPTKATMFVAVVPTKQSITDHRQNLIIIGVVGSVLIAVLLTVFYVSYFKTKQDTENKQAISVQDEVSMSNVYSTVPNPVTQQLLR